MDHSGEGNRLESSAAHPDVPLVLVFGRTVEPGEPFDHGLLFERLGRLRGRPFSHFLLQDRNRSGYYQGACRLGDSIEATVASLKAMIRELEPSRVITFGEGAGGHAALLFGILLGASRIVALEPPAHLIADELRLYNDRRWHRTLGELPDLETARRFDISRVVAEEAYQGRAFILFGTKRGNAYHDAVHLNAIHAHRLALADPITLCPFPDIRQNVLASLTRHGDADRVLMHYLFEDVGDATCAPPPPATLLKKSPGLTTKYHRPFKLQVITDANIDNGFTPSVAFAAAGEKSADSAQHVDDGWRSWITENLIFGESPIDLEDILVTRGISEAEAALEVANALQSPYFWGARRLQNRLKKRDWLLAAYRKLQRLRPQSAGIERRHKLSSDEWLHRYYSANRPVIMTGVLEDWPAIRTWSLDALSERFGERVIEVELGRDLGDKHERARPPEHRTMPMAEYVERLRQSAGGTGLADGSALLAGPGSANSATLAELWDDVADLSEYLESRETRADAFRLGAVGSIELIPISPVNSLVVQVLGRTHVTFAHSWDLPLTQGAPDVFARLEDEPRPVASPLPPDSPQLLECRLEPGEILFLPVGSGSILEALEASATFSFTQLRFANSFDGLPGNLER